MIEILLATYNGEKYLREQIDSLLNQTYEDFRIIVRDDGSDDGTIDIIKDYVSQYPHKVVFIEDAVKCGNPASNFMQLIQYATGDYIMFCDQDDVWFPTKLAAMMEEMERQEADKGVPVLVYGDYIIVDENLNRISQQGKSQIHNKKLDLAHLLVQNYVTGCCIMVNGALYRQIGQYSNDILMHDWWIAIYAIAFGKIEHLQAELMLYRQHSGQSVGARNIRSVSYIWAKLRSGDSKDSMAQYVRQAKFFLAQYGEAICKKNKKLLEAFIDIPQQGKIKKIFTLCKYRFFKNTVPRALGQLWYI